MIRSAAMTVAVIIGVAQASPAAAQINMSKELDHLHDAATALAASAPSFQEGLVDVARAHGAVAALRSGDDPKRVSCMLDQASFLVAAGQLDAARTTVATAAEFAEAKGDLAQAADAWVTAVMLARQAGDFAGAEVARQRAEWLATSTRLSGAESARIATRLYGEQWMIGGTPPVETDD